MLPHRKQLKRRENPRDARYLTCSCFHRLSLFQNDAIKDAFVEQLRLVKRTQSFWLIAWVVMPTHVHLLIVPDTPVTTVSRLLAALKRRFASIVLERWRTLDAPILARLVDASGAHHFWQQGGGYDRNEVTTQEVYEKIRYIHMNPVVAGLVARPEDWKWSSAAAYAKRPYSGPQIDHLALAGYREPRRD